LTLLSRIPRRINKIGIFVIRNKIQVTISLGFFVFCGVV
jgi:hypothetical protein